MQDKTDGELIAQFATTGQEEAFEELVRRHGPMVQNICSRVLGHRSDGEDLAQAVFLILAQKAPELTDRPSLAGWLHRVAWHTSQRARRAHSTRRRHERAAADAQFRAYQQAQRDCSLQIELDRVLNLVPELYREPLILHYLEGCSLERSAQIMNCPLGTVASRLARGREMLRQRLERWGLGLTLGVSGELLLQEIGAEGFAATVVTPVGSFSLSSGMTTAGAAAERSVSIAAPATSAAALTTAGVVGTCGESTVGVYGFSAGVFARSVLGLPSLAIEIGSKAGSPALGSIGSLALATTGASAAFGACATTGTAAATTALTGGGFWSAITSSTMAKAAAVILAGGAFAVLPRIPTYSHLASNANSDNPAQIAPDNHPSLHSDSGSPSTGSPVPEPATLTTLMAATLALLLKRRH